MNAGERRQGTCSGGRRVWGPPGIPLLEAVFANLQAHPGAEVEGALWHVRTTDLSILGRQEGGGDAYGSHHVMVDGPEGPVEARTYISERRVTGFRPSRRYVDLLLEGSREARLPPLTVDELSGTAVVDLPGARWVTPVLMRVLEKLFERGMNPKLLFDAYWRHVSKRP